MRIIRQNDPGYLIAKSKCCQDSSIYFLPNLVKLKGYVFKSNSGEFDHIKGIESGGKYYVFSTNENGLGMEVFTLDEASKTMFHQALWLDWEEANDLLGGYNEDLLETYIGTLERLTDRGEYFNLPVDGVPF